MGVNKEAAGEPKQRWMSGRRWVKGSLEGVRDPGMERRVSGKKLSFSERPAGPAPPRANGTTLGTLLSNLASFP